LRQVSGPDWIAESQMQVGLVAALCCCTAFIWSWQLDN
jgi:hypothetical protein